MDLAKWVKENIEETSVANEFLRMCSESFYPEEPVQDIEYLIFGTEHSFTIVYLFNDGSDWYDDEVIFNIREEK